MYDIRIPDRYINVHTTQVSGGEIMGRFIASENFTFVAGLETNFNTIASSSLGNHQQSLIAMYASLHYRTGDCIALDIGMRSDFHSDYGVQVNPTAGLGYNFSSSGKIFATIGRSYRAPSYTELYYSDPSTAGNPKLHPEEGWSYETGIDYILGINWHWSASLFERDQTNLIDYVRYLSSDTQSVAVNFTSAKTQGFDIDLRWQKIQFTSEIINESGISLQQFIFSYCYLNSQIERGAVYSSRYAFTHPRHRISAGISIIFPYAVEFSLDAVHNIKLNNDSYTLLNMRAAKHFTSAIIFIRGTNLLDKSYEEIIGIPLPGRWLWAGIEFKVF
jgi:iron complex outermembrane receptor protein